MTDEQRAALLTLSRVLEPGSRDLGDLVRTVGPVETLDRLVRGGAPAGLVDAARARLGTQPDPGRLAAEAETAAARLGARIVVPSDAEWPAQLDDLTQIDRADTFDRLDRDCYPPLALWVRGPRRLAEALSRAVAVVGARAASPYGTHVAVELGYGLADSGVTVVSGGAYGIDAAAHRGALTAGGTTIAVLACGLDVAYPAGHAGLFERISETGLIISEWPPGARPHRFRFLIRNRVIAAATQGTVVVEASARSGARQTARRAAELSRPLMAVPGPVTSAMSVGTHLEIRDRHATLVTSPADVLECVGRIGEDLAPLRRGPYTDRDALDPLAAQILDAVPARRPRSITEIAAEAGVAPADVARTLPLLSRLGFTREADSGYLLSPGRS